MFCSSTIVVILAFICQYTHTLEPFDPYKHDSNCKASMSTCSFELRATAVMTMFYKNLFRVVATDNGTLSHYEDSSRTFPMNEIITADGYPKLVV